MSANQYCITKHKKLSTFLPCFASCSSQSAEASNSRSLAGQWKHFIVFILLYYILPDIKCIEVTSWNSKVKISSFRTCKKWTKIFTCSCYEFIKDVGTDTLLLCILLQLHWLLVYNSVRTRLVLYPHMRICTLDGVVPNAASRDGICWNTIRSHL